MIRLSFTSLRTLCAAFLLASASTLFAADIPYVMPQRGICAHRGASSTHPENTLPAFREALKLGAQMIEFDVALTSDQRLVLMHDDTVDRTTNGSGAVNALSLQQLKELDAGSWKNRRYRGTRIPTLREALDIMPENIWLNIHLKGGADLAEQVAQVIVAERRQHQCFLACAKAAAKAALAISDTIKICNMERQANSEQYADDTIAAGAEFIQLLGGTNVEKTLTEKLHKANVKVNFCCTDDADVVKNLLSAGVDFPLSDNVAATLIATDANGIERLTPVYHARRESDRQIVKPVFADGEAQVVQGFGDSKEWIHHDLWVETEFDTDGNGKPDRMHVSVSRPRQTDTQGLKLPVVYVSSPYFAGTARGKNFFWNPKQELGAEPPKHDDPPEISLRTRRLIISATHLSTWIPRGYVVVHSCSPGTGLSQGCPTIGGDNESLAPKAVVQWLTGKANGFTTPDGDKPVSAYWSTGKVGMTGTSYNGTIPLAAATTGVEGLEAIIPVAPNTSYYHYYRSNGLVRHPGGYVGEDIDVLYNFVNSGNPALRDFCNANIRDKEMANGFDRDTGDYNKFWAGRDYINDLGPMKCALLMSHGFNDWNVMPEHSVRIYKAVQKKGLPVQCYFHQGGHGGPPPISMMNRWFTRFLFGEDNGVEKEPKSHIVREHIDRQKPSAYADYPNPAAQPVALFPQAGGNRKGALSLEKASGVLTEKIVDNYSFSGTALAQSDESPQRLLYVSPTLKSDLHISGFAKIKTRIACSKPAANFSVWLVSLPWTSGRRIPVFENIITRGWADPQNHSSLTDGQPLEPNRFYDLEFELQPDDHVIPAGRQIGLMVFSSDRDFTLWPEPGTEIEVDLPQTMLSLPIVGGEESVKAAF